MFFLQEYIFLTNSDTKPQDINWDGSRAEPSSHPPKHSLQRPPTPPRRSRPLNTRVNNSTALAVDTPPLFIPGVGGTVRAVPALMEGKTWSWK